MVVDDDDDDDSVISSRLNSVVLSKEKERRLVKLLRGPSTLTGVALMILCTRASERAVGEGTDNEWHS